MESGCLPSVDLVIRNAKIVTPAGIIEGELGISDGAIASISRSDRVSGAKTYDAKGFYVMPGVIDPHVHIWTDGQGKPFPDNCRSETPSMITGGVSSFIGHLRTTKPYDDLLPTFIDAIPRSSLVDIAFHVVVNHQEHSGRIPQYAEAFGVTSFKFYMGPKGTVANVGGLGADDGLIYSSFAKIRDLGFPGIGLVHAENIDIIEIEKARLMAEGRQGTLAWSDSRPNISEEEAVQRAILLAGAQRCPLYVVHVTVGTVPSMIMNARLRGQEVYGETCIHHLTFTKYDKLDPPGKHMPPLRGPEDVEKIWEGLQNGGLSCVASDHQSGRMKSELVKEEDIWGGRGAGFAGAGHILPVMLSEGVNKSRLTLERCVEVCSTNTARCFGLYPKKGVLMAGSDADIVVVDLKKEQICKPEVLNLFSDYSRYDGWRLKGWPVATFVGGELVMEEGRVLSETRGGEYLPRKPRVTAAFNPRCV
ncbi:MAG: amidohydrolase family protein [Thaumarchaeota archaeon]|nr:amidohydrolase family protein [Nitrososphaerota archaeon]